MGKEFDGSMIVSLLQDLDRRIKEPCRIIICGGAAAIVCFGIKRLTGDIDILEPYPKSDSFYKAVKEVSVNNGLDSGWLNDGAKGFADCLNPDFINRLTPLEKSFSNLEVFIISKPDLITMKICAWRETDKEDIKDIGISDNDIAIIKANLEHVATHSPDRAQKANLVLSELGITEVKTLKPEEVTGLSELIQFYSQHEKKDPSIETIRKWRDKIDLGLKPSFLAQSLFVNNQKEQSLGMDL